MLELRLHPTPISVMDLENRAGGAERGKKPCKKRGKILNDHILNPPDIYKLVIYHFIHPIMNLFLRFNNISVVSFIQYVNSSM